MMVPTSIISDAQAKVEGFANLKKMIGDDVLHINECFMAL